jgi:hypothetical protein
LLVVVAVIAAVIFPEKGGEPMLRHVIDEVRQQRDAARTERSTPV